MTLEEKLQARTPAEEAVKAYLIANASDVLTEKIINGKKNVKDCLTYIAKEVKKKATANCYVGTDEEVYGMAIHYFEEDDISIDNTKYADVGVQPNKEAKEETTEEAKPKPKTEKKPKAKKKEEPEQQGFTQMSLFDL